MTLTASGQISIGGNITAQSIEVELGQSGLVTASLNDTAFRTLAGKSSGQISMSDFYAKSVSTAGIWAWGYNYSGQLGNGSLTESRILVQVGNLTNWNQVACGNYHTAAIKSDGTLWAWGTNSDGQLGNGSLTESRIPVQVGNLTNWKQVACGNYHTAAIKSDGTLWAWGYNYYGQLGIGSDSDSSIPVQVGNLTNWNQVACGTYHTAAINI